MSPTVILNVSLPNAAEAISVVVDGTVARWAATKPIGVVEAVVHVTAVVPLVRTKTALLQKVIRIAADSTGNHAIFARSQSDFFARVVFISIRLGTAKHRRNRYHQEQPF